MTCRQIAVLLLFVIQIGSTLALSQQTGFKVLAFYSATTEPDHVQFARDAVKFFTKRAAEEHFTFEATTKWDDLNDERLKPYQLVIWLNESPSNGEQRRAFERYMERGGAWLGFHAAAYNDKDTNWPWFVDFLGGAVFDTNSWPPLPARIVVDDRAHPVTEGLAGDFESPANEWYVWKPSPRLNEQVRVLASFDPANYPIGFKDVLTAGDLPVVWTNTRYKMLYMNMGHGDKIFTSPIQNQLIDNAVRWLGAGAAPNEKPEAVGIRISPSGIVLNPQSGKFYAVNTGQDAVTVLDGDGHFLKRVAVGKEPASIAINPDTNRIYVANGGSGSVIVLDGATDAVMATVPVGDLPYTIAANRVTNKVYVSRTFSDVTVIIDGKTNLASTVKAGVGDAVAAGSLDHKTYLMSYEAPKVAVFDGSDDQPSRVDAPDHLWAIAANPLTHKVYAASAGNAKVVVIDGKSQAARLVDVGEIPCAVAVDASSGRVFVANYASGSVSVIDGASDAVVANVKVSEHPQALAVDSDSHRVYVASTHAGTVTILDGTTNSVLARVETVRAPFAVAANGKTHKAVALGLAGDLTVVDGKSLTAAPVAMSQKQ